MRKILLAAPPAVLGLALSGCQDGELRARVSNVEAQVVSAADRPSAPIVSRPPLRRAPPAEASAALLGHLVKSLFAPFSFTPRLVDGGVLLTASGEWTPETATWLGSNGFVNSGQVYRRTVGPGGLVRLREAVSAFAQRHSAGLETPKAAPKLVWTGHPLDLATKEPDVFVEIESTALESARLVRGGGSAYVDADGRLAFEGAGPLSGISRVRDDAESLSVERTGEVFATSATQRTSLGTLKLLSVASGAYRQEGRYCTAARSALTGANSAGAILPGHLYVLDSSFEWARSVELARFSSTLELGLTEAERLLAAPNAARTVALPLTIHAPLNLSAEHLHALGIDVKKRSERTVIGAGATSEVVAKALGTVLDGLTRRIAIHEENLRNAGKTRDAEGKLNPYRRKMIVIGPGGVVEEQEDKAPAKKNYKPGDPDAGPDGVVLLSNVDKPVETAELKAATEEYKLIRAALERLNPSEIYPDPAQ